MSRESLSCMADPSFATASGSGGSGLHISRCGSIGEDREAATLVEAKAGMITAAPVCLPEAGQSVLLVDDEPKVLASFSLALQHAGIRQVHTLEDGSQVLPLLDSSDVAVVVLDLSMPTMSGSELLEEISRGFPQIPVIVMTADDDLDTAVSCMKAGAVDYLTKPVEMSRFLSSVGRALELNGLRNEVSSLKQYLLNDQLRHEPAFSSIITRNKQMRALFQYVEIISGSGQPVLITGETGTGKELFARVMHDLSGRKGPFVPVNVAGLDDSSFSDTLFGHRKGAFTGAEQTREGLIGQAAGGTVLLDEIGDLSESSQVKMLRLLQEQEYLPLGSDFAKKSNARFVLTTNRDVPALMAAGKFRKDLYYRICAHQVGIPPLRERSDDLPLLVDHFVAQAAEELRKRTPSYPPELITLLSTYRFPGNVRELRTLVVDAVARHASGVLSLDRFREAICRDHPFREPGPESFALSWPGDGLLPKLKEAETVLIAEALRRSKGNQGIAASLLGMTRQALNKRLVRAGHKRGAKDYQEYLLAAASGNR